MYFERRSRGDFEAGTGVQSEVALACGHVFAALGTVCMVVPPRVVDTQDGVQCRAVSGEVERIVRVKVQLEGVAVVVAEDATSARSNAEMAAETILELNAGEGGLVARDISGVYAERLLTAERLGICLQ